MAHNNSVCSLRWHCEVL